jgi:putative transposase
LFSTDLEQSYDKIIKFYELRFQIEFNFRDAKQYWGLDDFMNVKETAVTNAANKATILEEGAVLGLLLLRLCLWL